jgi:hypothetical protein
MKRILFLMLAALCINGDFVHAAGKTGLTFLKLETGSRFAAMGGAATALYHEASILHYNPAGLAGIPKSEIQLMHTSWIGDMSTQYGVFAIAMNRATLGISLYNSSVEDIEVRTRPGPPESTFNTRNFAAGATFAYRTSPSFRVGLTAKLLYEKIYIDEATGYAFDLGVLYRTSTPGLYFGLSVLNIGSMNELRSEQTNLPLNYRFGSSYDLPAQFQDFTVKLAVDVMKFHEDDKLHLMFGGEFTYSQALFLRLGYHSGVDARSLSAGVGIRHGIAKIDYAFIPMRNDLGAGHSLTLGIIFR